MKLNTAASSLAVALTIAFSGAVAAQEMPKLVIATGPAGNPYHKKCEALRGDLKGKVDVTCLPTGGTINAFEAIRDGKAKGAIAQANLYPFFARQHTPLEITTVAPILDEAFQVICNKEYADANDIESFDDFVEKKPVTLIGNYGGGSQASWDSWVLQDERFASGWNGKTRNEGGTKALLQVVVGKAAQCMIAVAAPGAESIRQLNDESKGKVKLIPFFDQAIVNSFKDASGDPVYHFTTIPGDTYSNLNPSGFWGGGAIDTLGTSGVLVITNDLHGNDALMNHLSLSVLKVSN